LYVTYFDSLRLAKGAFRVTVSTTLLTLSSCGRSVISPPAYSAPRTSCSSARRSCRRDRTLAGEWVHDRIAPLVFRRCVGGLLVLSGSALLVR
jgi:hypothetical protein